MGNALYWDSTYEIVLNLMRNYPVIDLNAISTSHLLEMILALPNFVDEPQLANEDLLVEILRFWYEEAM